MNQDEFGFRVRQALNEGADRLDYKTVLRLEKARSAALARQRRAGPATVRLPALQLATATAGGPPVESGRGAAWLRGAAWVVPMLALVIGFFAISDWQKQREIADLAALDFAVLLDDGPLETYADRGFSVLLQAERPANR